MVAVSAAANAGHIRIDIDHQYTITLVAAGIMASLCVQHKFRSLARISAFLDSLVCTENLHTLKVKQALGKYSKTDYLLKQASHIGTDSRQRLVGVNNVIALRVAIGTLQIGRANAGEKFNGFLFKAVQLSTLASASHTGFHWRIQQHNMVRAKLALHQSFQQPDTLGGRATATALIGEGCIGKTVTQHPLSGG
jgi:hypothetical protein